MECKPTGGAVHLDAISVSDLPAHSNAISRADNGERWNEGPHPAFITREKLSKDGKLITPILEAGPVWKLGIRKYGHLV
jgi:hypothetical protein